MDPLLFEALKNGAKIVHLVTVALPGHMIRWTDGGFVRWGGDVWRGRDDAFGMLSKIGEITDGVDDDADSDAAEWRVAHGHGDGRRSADRRDGDDAVDAAERPGHDHLRERGERHDDGDLQRGRQLRAAADRE